MACCCCQGSGACCLPGGTCAETTACQCQEVQGQFYEGLTCEESPCGIACCLPDGSCIDVTSEGECYEAGGSPRVGKKCEDEPCGTCCLPPNAVCSDDFHSREACEAEGGSWKANERCTEEPCCLTDANCPGIIEYAAVAIVDVYIPVGCFDGAPGWRTTGFFPGLGAFGWRYEPFALGLGIKFCTYAEAEEKAAEVYTELQESLDCEPFGAVTGAGWLYADKCCFDGRCNWCDPEVAAFVEGCNEAP